MSKNMSTIAIVVIILAIAGFFLLSQNTSTPTLEPTLAPSDEMMTVDSISVALLEQNDSGETGIATLTEQDGELIVTLAMEGAPAGIVQPAHIHLNNCADIGGVLHPLEFPVDGESVTTLPTSLSELAEQMPLSINVHKSGPESSVYVSCGDLEL